MGIGTTLKHRREMMELSQENIAQKLYVSRQTISNWELEKTYPDIEKLIALSEFYEVTLDELVKEDPKMKEKLIADAKNLEKLKKHRAKFRTSQRLSAVAFGGLLFSNKYTWLLVGVLVVCTVISLYHWIYVDGDEFTSAGSIWELLLMFLP